MTGPVQDDERMPDEYAGELRDAIEADASAEVDWPAFHQRLNRMIADGGAWWDYAARAALAAVPLALAAGLLLAAFLSSGGDDPSNAPPLVALATTSEGSPAAARAAFESVLTGVEAPREAIRTLIPMPAAAFLVDSSGGAR